MNIFSIIVIIWVISLILSILCYQNSKYELAVDIFCMIMSFTVFVWAVYGLGRSVVALVFR